MIAELLIAAVMTIPCSSLAAGPEMVNKGNITKLSHRMVYRRWDTNGSGRADLMTAHVIPEKFMEGYWKHFKEGVTFDVEFSKRPLFYWVDVTLHNSWDRIYIDKQRTGRCELYASQYPEEIT